MATYRGEEIDLKPTSGMKTAAQRALDWRREFGRGGTRVGISRARDIVNGKELSPSTVKRMKSFFARHEVDKDAEGFRSGEDGYPSNGRIAWDLWGGDPGKSWSERKTAELDRIDDEKGDKMSKEHFAAGFEIKSLTEKQEDGSDYYEFEGYASTFGNEDLGGDIVMQGAFKGSIDEMKQGRRRIPILWQHEREQPVGVFVDMREDTNGLFVRGMMPKDDTMVSGRVYPQMKVGAICQMSIGFYVKEYEVDEENQIRKLNNIDLREISLVTFPMNERANITSVKAEDINDFLELDDRTMEKTFRKGVKLSEKGAKTLVSILRKARRDVETQAARDVIKKGDAELAGMIRDIMLDLEKTNV